MKIFDKIYVINLPSRPDRKYQIESQLKQMGQEYEILPAVSGKDFKNQLAGPDAGRNGCSVSHILAFKRAEYLGLDNYLILEDDAVLRMGFPGLMKNCMQDLPDGWDMLYLGASIPQEETTTRITDRIHRLHKAFTTHAYMVNMKDHFLFKAMIEQFDFSMPIDAWFSIHHREHIQAFITVPPLAWQREGFSDIEGRNMNYNWIEQGSGIAKQ